MLGPFWPMYIHDGHFGFLLIRKVNQTNTLPNLVICDKCEHWDLILTLGHGTTSQSVQGTTSQSVQGTTSQSVQGTTSESVQGTTSQSVQGTTSQSVQGTTS